MWKDSPQLAENRPSVPEPVKPATPTQVRFGITIMNLKDKERQDLGIDDRSGVKVVSVDPGSFADDIGVQENDTILSINRQPVCSADDVMRLQRALRPGAPVALHIVRSTVAGGRHIPPNRYYLSGRLPEE
ncbi:MAG: PDZ domain-containing protein [Acidobacteriaceae bacterium]|nr:PDZ domain-containing protein [Acidobacteriaceae bacterium]